MNPYTNPSLHDSNNQFMAEQPTNNSMNFQSAPKNPEEIQKLMGMFQQMMTDPSSFMKMMMESSQSMGQPIPPQASHQYHKQSGVMNGQVKYSDVRSRRTEGDSHKNHGYLQKYKTHQNQQNCLNSYLPQQQPVSKFKGQQNLNLANSSVSVQEPYCPRPSHTFDEKPINSKYIEQTKTEENIKENRSFKHSFDDIPIKPAEGFAYNLQKSQQSSHDFSKTIPNQEIYYMDQERPIKGIQGGDFKEFLKNQEGINFDEDEEQYVQKQDDQGEHKKTKPFLKRGSRQYLSSAKDRPISKAKKNTKKKEDLNLSSSRLKQSEKTRSVSQNRVLGIGKKARNQKSASKLPKVINQKKMDEFPKENMESSKLPTSRNQESSLSPTFKDIRDTSPKVPKVEKKTINNKKIKNIFNVSSSEEEDQSNSPHQQQSWKKNSPILQKTEVIKGVFLTKKQLHEILTKYGNQQQPKNSQQQQKLKELKNKYLDLCNLLAQEKAIFEQEMVKEREEFEAIKQNQLQKLKNQRKVQERNLMATKKEKQREKQQEEFEILRKEVQKEREEFKKKDKNNRIILEKYKKQLQETKMKLSVFESMKNNRDVHSTAVVESKGEAKNEKKVPKLPPKSQKKEKKIMPKFQESEHDHQSQEISENNTDHYSSSIYSNNKLPNYNQLKSSNFNQEKKEPKNLAINQPNSVTGQNKQYSDDEDQNSEEEHQNQQIVEYNSTMKLQDLTKIPLSIKMVTDEMVDNLFRYDRNPEYIQYKNAISKNRTKIHTSRNAAERKLTNIYSDGGKEVIFQSGVRKQFFSNGYTIVIFTNGDIKQVLSDKTILYFYREKEVDQITLPNGINIYRFDNNQVQFHFSDGSVQIRHPDGTFKVL